jgi:hypothetical protein
MSKYTYTTQAQVRVAFWAAHPECERIKKPGRQNQQLVGVRVAFVDFVDHLQRSGDISEALAQRATL